MLSPILKGKHAFKFGYEYTHIEADSNIPNYGRGRVNFNGAAWHRIFCSRGHSAKEAIAKRRNDSRRQQQSRDDLAE